jgi:hypothetical protein
MKTLKVKIGLTENLIISRIAFKCWGLPQLVLVFAGLVFSSLTKNLYFCTAFAKQYFIMRKLVLIICATLALSSCKKEESPDPKDVNRNTNASIFPGPKAEVVISNTWKLTDKVVEYTNGLPTEDFTNVPACQKDNLLVFKKTKKYDVQEATNICPGNQPTTTYDWKTSDDESTITLNGTVWQVVTVDNTTMKLRNINASQALTVTTTETYTAQ